MLRIHKIALATAIIIASVPGIAGAFADCPADSIADGYTCTELKGVGKNGGYFRATIPSNWDGDLVLVNHGFDLNDKHIRPHEVCGDDPNKVHACQTDADCPGSFCNNISYMGVDEILLPMGKAVIAGTYSQSGWAVFGSAKDLKDMIDFVKKDATYGDQVKRVIATGFSLGGAVTGDAVLKLKLDGAVPLCAAVGGGLPTWDVAQDVRLVYDFLCRKVPGARFQSAPDVGEQNSTNSGTDATSMALRVDNCFGVIGFATHTPEMDTRLAQFIALTKFTGQLDPAGPSAGGVNVASAMGFATLGLGDFVRDPERLKSARIGFNDTLDYSDQGTDPVLAATYNAPRVCSGDASVTCILDSDCANHVPAAGTCTGGVQRLTQGKGRKKLTKASYPDFTKGKPAKISYPILSMAGANDWLVIPEFERVFDTALTDGGKLVTQTWIDTFGHCAFSAEETTAVYNKYFEWIGLHAGDTPGTQPTPADVHQECLDIGGVEGDTCNFNDTFVPGHLSDRIPVRSDWPLAATE